MNRSVWSRLKQSLAVAEQWYRRTPERALTEAYEAAQAIKRLEDQHFNGETIDATTQGEGAVSVYFQTQIQKYLKIIRVRLTEYKFCSPVIDPDKPRWPNRSRTPVTEPNFNRLSDESALSEDAYIAVRTTTVDLSQETLDKLKFIDSVLLRYEPWRSPTPIPAAPNTKLSRSNVADNGQPTSQSLRSVQDSFYNPPGGPPDRRKPSSSDGNSFIPRSILKTADRFRRELDPTPQTEEEVVQNFRIARVRTRAATRFLLLLIVLPLLTQQLCKVAVVGPIVDHVRGVDQVELWVKPRVEEKFLSELIFFEEKLKFQNLLAETPQSATQMEDALKDKAREIQQDFQKDLKEPIKNIFSDLFSLMVFSGLVLAGRQEIATLKAFIDEIVYGLSDSAKAFIIILLTDVFVGFHSPHGWEVIMESTLEHFGLPLNHSFINMFIATFPVMLDTVFKYWIFRYLNQISPSAVATYRNMNE